MIVKKFGGTSVGSAARMRAVAEIVASSADHRSVVVTSAMSGVTDQLTRLLELALDNQRESMEGVLDALRERHRGVAVELVPEDRGFVERLEERLRDLRVLLRGARLTGRITPRSADAVLGFGELLAQELLVAALIGRGRQAVLVDSREAVATDERFGAARPLLAETEMRCRAQVVPWVEKGVIPVLGGYLGSTLDGIPTTLGRGGSDLSASILALVLDAHRVEIWTDVDGVMTADPRVVRNARVIDQIGFRQAAVLSAHGAKVLHPASIAPAIRGGIPVRICNAMAPDHRGTQITAQADETSSPRIESIAHRKGLALLVLEHGGAMDPSEQATRVLGILAERGIDPISLSFGPLETRLLIDLPEARLSSTLEALEGTGELRVRGRLGMVAVVGHRVLSDSALLSLLREGLERTPILQIDDGNAGDSLGFLVEEENVEELARSLHRRLLEKDA